MHILTGPEIEELASKGILFRSGFKKSHCETMFYSLTLGHRVQSVTKNEHEFRKLKEPLIIGPRETVNVEILEKFRFADEQGRPRYGGLIVSIARMLAGGIAHPATVVDPGFDRATYLTLVNLRSYPGPRMFPGRDKIAKMIIFAFETGEQIPPPWETTPAYELVSQDELPVFWASPAEPWQPARQTTRQDLERLIDWGTPYDHIAVALLEHSKAMDDFQAKMHSVEGAIAGLRETFAAQEKQLLVATTKLDKMAEDLARTQGEVAVWYQQRMEQAERQVDRRSAERQFQQSIWISAIIAVVSAIIGGLTAIYWNEILRVLRSILQLP